MNISENKQGNQADSARINVKLSAFSQTKKRLSEELTNQRLQLEEQIQEEMREVPADIKFPNEGSKSAL